MYINENTNQLYSENEIRNMFPNTSFPMPFVPPSEFKYIFPYPKPEHSYRTHYVVSLPPELTVLGHWEERWGIQPRPQEEVDKIIADELKARVPPSVSPRQIRQALTRVGLRTALENAIANADQDTKDWYEFATDFRRDNPVVSAMGTILGVPDSDLDNLWILAGSL